MSDARMPALAVPVRFRTPLTIALVALTAAGLVLNAVVATPRTGFVPIDYDLFGPAGGQVLTGRWSTVFGDPIIQAGPLELVFWGIPFLLGVAGLAGWIAFGIVAGGLFAVAYAAVCERLLRPLTPVWSVTLGVGCAALLSLTGVLTSGLSSGHPAEIAIPLMWIGAGVLARRGHPLVAAAVVGATAGWELWGLLGVPILLLAPRIGWREVWRSAVGGGVALAVLFLPFALLGPFEMFGFSWPIRTNTLAHVLFPDSMTFAWPLRLVQGVLAVGAGAAAAALTRRSPDAIWLPLVLVCVVRLFTDPVLAPYYGIPPIMLLLLGGAMAIAQRAVLPFLACLVMVNLFIDLPLSYITAGVLLVLSALTAVVVVRSSRRLLRSNMPRLST